MLLDFYDVIFIFNNVHITSDILFPVTVLMKTVLLKTHMEAVYIYELDGSRPLP